MITSLFRSDFYSCAAVYKTSAEKASSYSSSAIAEPLVYYLLYVSYSVSCKFIILIPVCHMMISANAEITHTLSQYGLMLQMKTGKQMINTDQVCT